MSEFAKDDNITNSGTDIRETLDDKNEILNELDLKTRDDKIDMLYELDLKNQKIAELEHEKMIAQAEVRRLKNKLKKTQRKLYEIQQRFVSEFHQPENAGLEHYLYIIVKNPRLTQYNKSRGLYYVPAAKNLRDDMKPEKLRFVALRVQERNARQSLRKWLSDGGKIVLCRKVPDPVNWVNLLHRELGVTGVGGSRNLFQKMMSNRNPLKIVKHSNWIDFNRDVYFDPQYALCQKKMTNYFKSTAVLAE